MNQTSLDIDAILFEALDSSPTKLLIYAAIGLCLEGIVFGAIAAQTSRYFETFSSSDPWSSLILVAGGFFICLAQLGLTIWETVRLAQYAPTNFSAIYREDIFANTVVHLFIVILNASGTIFFSKRAWKMTGGKWLIIFPLVLGIASCSAMGLGVVGLGFSMPAPEVKNLLDLLHWQTTISTLVYFWASFSIAIDIFVGSLMAIWLLRNKSDFRATNINVLQRLLILTFETMTPPIISDILILTLSLVVGKVTLADFTRALSWIQGPLYFHAITYSLVRRADVRVMVYQSSDRKRGRGDTDVTEEHRESRRRSSQRVDSPAPAAYNLEVIPMEDWQPRKGDEEASPE